MSRRFRLLASLGLGALLAVPALAEQKLEDVTKAISEANAKVKSYTAKMKTEAEMMGNKMTSEMTMEIMRKDGKILSHTETKGQMQMGETKMEQNATSVCDGEFIYVLSESMGQKNAMKMKYDPKQTGDAESMLKEYTKQYDVKLLADEKVGDVDCYALEGKAKDGAAAGGPAKQNLYFCKKTGILMKATGFDKDGKQMMSATTSDLKLDAEIKKERFEFKAPEGVQVMDMTNMGGGPASKP